MTGNRGRKERAALITTDEKLFLLPTAKSVDDANPKLTAYAYLPAPVPLPERDSFSIGV
jgi:hypothetical protein